MILKWKGSRVWGVCKVTLEADPVLLRPGLNTLADSEWNEIKDQVDVKARLKANTLEIVQAAKSEGEKKDSGEESTGAATDLGGLNTEKSKELIKDTYSVKQLNAWKESETRAGVMKAIDAQLEKIEQDRSGTDKQEPQE